MKTNSSSKASQIIVSFTSYPARIGFIPRVLESLYAQSKRPDKILLWLAEEQFPNREADLPDELIEDKNAGKFELRWCDDLGSHKKYFYAMQEYPEDIIITFDDDMIYHRDTIKTLCDIHNKYPEAVACIYAKLMLFDDKHDLLPYIDWLYNVVLPVPSMQIIPMGSGGVLYPPHILDKGVFDKQTILSKLKYKGVVCDDDMWLKTHSLLAGVPSVTQPEYLISHQVIPTTNNIGSLDTSNQQQQNLLSAELLSRKSSDKKQSIQEVFKRAREEGDYYDFNSTVVRERTYQFVLDKLNIKIESEYNAQFGDTGGVGIGYLHYVLSFFTTAMALGDTELSEKYIVKLKEAFKRIPDIDEFAKKSKFIDALLNYDDVLLDDLNVWHKQLKNYYQMLKNWKGFFQSYTKGTIPYTYYFSYIRFLRNMDRYSEIMRQTTYSTVQIREMKKCVKTELKKIPFAFKIKYLVHATAKKTKRAFNK